MLSPKALDSSFCCFALVCVAFTAVTSYLFPCWSVSGIHASSSEASQSCDRHSDPRLVYIMPLPSLKIFSSSTSHSSHNSEKFDSVSLSQHQKIQQCLALSNGKLSTGSCLFLTNMVVFYILRTLKTNTLGKHAAS
ncbi:hypothetical protein K432DRAFT_172495 [Lepidopterella palustris CBS 459.81]|uniref:Uncharacterized protein n=1 Tax=Lepidopterella palustris CBS 459.81 TaxID=1314670 RepID=A0A8E2E1D6_9PEZI|nr:hypothetical protein K432DRAFT_172495 [Lepidopterella palustris CBS 459.81]